MATDDPVPVKGTFTVGFAGSLLVMLMFPLTLPAAVGENVTTAWADCPAEMVFGVEMPATVN